MPGCGVEGREITIPCWRMVQRGSCQSKTQCTQCITQAGSLRGLQMIPNLANLRVGVFVPSDLSPKTPKCGVQVIALTARLCTAPHSLFKPYRVRTNWNGGEYLVIVRFSGVKFKASKMVICTSHAYILCIDRSLKLMLGLATMHTAYGGSSLHKSPWEGAPSAAVLLQ